MYKQNDRKRSERWIALAICLALLASFVPAFPLAMNAQAAGEKTTFSGYATLAKVYEQDGCFSMQGMAVHENYVYACKTNNGEDTKAVVARININNGSKTFLTNAATGTYVFTDFVHGNEIEVERIGGKVTMFIPTMASGSESLIRYEISGTTATRVGNYTMQCNGSNISGGAIRVMHYSENYITFIFKSGNTFYTGTIPVNQYSGTVDMSVLFHFNYSQMCYNGVIKDISGFSLQGFEYYDGRIYLPLSGHTVSGMVNVAIILVYDIQGIKPGVTLDPERNLNFYVVSQEYPAYFEIESCGISPRTGKMYFNTNSRVTNTNTNHDGVHYFTDWEYEPSQRNTDVNNYRWEVVGDKLTSVTTNGSALNHAIMLQGSVSNKEFTLCRYATDRTVVLEHHRPWQIEWKASSTDGHILFGTEGDCAHPNAPYVSRRVGTDILSMGYYDGGHYHDYGVDLSHYGIDPSQTHVYRISNRISADGSNMVYLSVDGKELAPMNNYYVDGVSQETTSDWISGQDFRFSYLGVYNYRLDCMKLYYIQAWGNGEDYKPNGIYRWETQNDQLTAVMGDSIPTLTYGAISGGTYTTSQHSLSQGVTLMHDQPWTIQWRGAGSTGGGSLLASDNRGDCTNTRYLMRNAKVLFFGYRDSSNHYQYGINPADHGVDMSREHLFTLQNKVNTDGSNMVYLSVDGKELGAMNQYYKNGSSQGSTSDWISGKDFAFNWMGTLPYSVNQQTLDYMQIWENGIVTADVEDTYRWETRNDSFINISGDGLTVNTAEKCSGSISGGMHTSTSYQLGRTVVLRHDRNWSIQWQCQAEATASGMILSCTAEGDEPGNYYLFRNVNQIGIGTHTGARHEQWGVGVAKHGIDHTLLHTYELKNQLNGDGTNTIWLYLDGEELAPMVEHFVYGNVTSDPDSDWLSGKDFTFNYIGNELYPIKGIALNYLQINEGCAHTYGAWSVTAATCTQAGFQSRSCTKCGAKQTQTLTATGHSYSLGGTIAPNCTEAGYTTYTCTLCGDSYQGERTNPIGHSYSTIVTTAPTCTKAGYTTYTCIHCGDSYKENETAPTGHNYMSVVIDPTCTNGGYTTYRCRVCGDTYQGNDTAASGHHYQTVVTAPTCTEQGYTNYTCTTCGAFYQSDYIQATGHRYSSIVIDPTCVNGGYTTYTCSGCGYSYKDRITNPTGHRYTNGICATCGAVDPDYTPASTVPTLTLKAPTLEFKDMICVIAFYTAENTQDVEEMGMITYSSKAATVDITTAEHVIPGAEYDASTGRYYSGSQGIHAKYLADTVYLAVYAKLTDGTYAYSRLAPYSAITYAKSQLKNSTDTKLKQLVVSMLNYGAAAQMYFGHNTENLANAALTQDQLALPESYRADMAQSVPAVPAGKTGSFTNNLGFSSRKPAVSFEGAFSINYFFTPKYAPVDGITLYYWTEADYNAVSVLTARNATGVVRMEGSGTGQYRGDIDGISAKNLSQAIYVAAVYSDGTTPWTSGVLGYSIGAYCGSQATKGGAMADLAMTTAVYGYHAMQYFG